MSDALSVITPVLFMIVLGMFIRYKGWISEEAIGGMKFLVTRIILPAAIFHALATADYSRNVVIVCLIVLAAIILSFGAGYLVKPLVEVKYRAYVPFMVSVYEGGMMAYPLFTSICGSNQLSKIALLDIAGLLFGFSVYMGLLEQTEKGETNVAGLFLSAFRSPAFLAALFGLVLGATGIMTGFMRTAAAPLYSSVISMITTPLSAIILLIIGYEFVPVREMIRPCLKTVALRAVIQAATIAFTLAMMGLFLPADPIRTIAVIMYMSAPATFSMQSFIKNKEGSAYAATSNSIYCLLTIGVYIVMAFGNR